MASGSIPDITVRDYLKVLQDAHAALDAIAATCLEGRDPDTPISDDDWKCIKTTYDELMRERGGPPLGGDEC